MSDDVYEEVSEGRGTEFGTEVHEFALGKDVEPSRRAAPDTRW